MIDKIIKVAYGDAGLLDWIFIRLRSITNEEIKSLFEDYRHTANVVHKLKQEVVPELITERVKSITGGINKRDSLLSNFSYRIVSFFANKAIPATVVGVLIVSIISLFLFQELAPSHKYSRAEIELAEKQFRQSIAIVGRTFQKAEKSFSKEVLKDQINKNLNRGYYLVNNILIGG